MRRNIGHIRQASLWESEKDFYEKVIEIQIKTYVVETLSRMLDLTTRQWEGDNWSVKHIIYSCRQTVKTSTSK